MNLVICLRFNVILNRVTRGEGSARILGGDPSVAEAPSG